MSWEFLPHTADIRVRFTARDLEALLGDATDLVAHLTAGGAAGAAAREARPLRLTAGGPDELLFAYLKELLFLYATESFVPGAIQVRSVSPTGLDAVVRGERFDPDRHEPQPEVKAVTRHGLRVENRDGEGWEAEVVFDL